MINLEIVNYSKLNQEKEGNATSRRCESEVAYRNKIRNCKTNCNTLSSKYLIYAIIFGNYFIFLFKRFVALNMSRRGLASSLFTMQYFCKRHEVCQFSSGSRKTFFSLSFKSWQRNRRIYVHHEV